MAYWNVKVSIPLCCVHLPVICKLESAGGINRRFEFNKTLTKTLAERNPCQRQIYKKYIYIHIKLKAI